MYTFVSGNTALDFAGTVRNRDTTPLDLLSCPGDLDGWLREAGVLDNDAHCGTAEFESAIELREAIYRLARAAAEEWRWRAADVELINRAAAGRRPTPVLRDDATVQHLGTCAQALAALAADAVELLGGPDRGRVEQCEREGCTRLYVDTSRAGSRRWCDMAICGNRAKSASFRARRG